MLQHQSILSTYSHIFGWVFEDGLCLGWDWDLLYSGMSGNTGATRVVAVITGSWVGVGVGVRSELGWRRRRNLWRD